MPAHENPLSVHVFYANPHSAGNSCQRSYKRFLSTRNYSPTHRTMRGGGRRRRRERDNTPHLIIRRKYTLAACLSLKFSYKKKTNKIFLLLFFLKKKNTFFIPEINEPHEIVLLLSNSPSAWQCARCNNKGRAPFTAKQDTQLSDDG